MNILGCLDTPTSGNYTLEGVAFEDLNRTALIYVIRNWALFFKASIFCTGPQRWKMLNYPCRMTEIAGLPPLINVP
nr:hypothetical protein [Desulfosediminicola flagellatus]